MTQYVIAEESTGRVLGFVDQDSVPDPYDGHLIVENPSPVPHFPEAPTPTSILKWANSTLVWEESVSLAEAKLNKNAEINQWRAKANSGSFPFNGKLIACDALSRSDIDGVANHVGLFGEFPPNFPMAWKAVDNTYVPLPDVAAFKAMYSAMTSQGTANFERAQSLKYSLTNATTVEDVSDITWE